jgi:hypothetical protein
MHYTLKNFIKLLANAFAIIEAQGKAQPRPSIPTGTPAPDIAPGRTSRNA